MMRHALPASFAFGISTIAMAFSACLSISVSNSFASPGDPKAINASNAVQPTGKRSASVTQTQQIDNSGHLQQKVIEQKGTKSAPVMSGSTVSKGSMALYSENAIKSYNKAVEFHRTGILDRAAAEYEAAIKSDEKMSEAYTNLGTIYVAQHDYKKAIRVLSKSCELSPNKPVTMNAYAGALFNDGAKEEAIELWKRVIKLDPSFSSAYTNLADALDDMGHFDEAKKIRNHNAPAPVTITPAGDFDNGDLPLQYKPTGR